MVRARRRGFSLTELVVVVAIILVLVALLIPAVSVVRERQRRAQAVAQVAQIHMAVQNYAAEDRRHRFPPMHASGDLSLRLDPGGGTPGSLNLLMDRGVSIDTAGLLREGPPPWPLGDPWGKPYRYQTDEDLRTYSTPQRPLPLEAWNAKGVRPWAYIWSAGRAYSSDGTGWIYQRDDQ